jgi:hypothetical protein
LWVFTLADNWSFLAILQWKWLANGISYDKCSTLIFMIFEVWYLGELLRTC